MTIYWARCCPFCKCNQVSIRWIAHADKPCYAECVKCFARGPLSEDKVKAIKSWNTRKYSCLGDE